MGVDERKPFRERRESQALEEPVCHIKKTLGRVLYVRVARDSYSSPA